jgi:hypothetical protein
MLKYLGCLVNGKLGKFWKWWLNPFAWNDLGKPRRKLRKADLAEFETEIS